MTTATCEPGAGCEAAGDHLREDFELIDELREFQFVWPTAEDAGVAAKQGELNVSNYWVARTTHQLRDRQVIIARHETDEGERAAREIARECLDRKAYSVHIWAVPEFGTRFSTLEEWASRHDLLTVLALERARKYPGFVRFVSSPRGDKPVFEGDPRPIAAELAAVPPLMPEMIPEPFRAWCLDIANRLWCPLEYVATPLVVVLSGVIGRRIAIRPKRADDWKEVPNLWGALVGPPGSLKTPAIAEVCRPLRVLDAEEQRRHKRAVAEHQQEAMVASARKTAARKSLEQAARKRADDDELRELAREAVGAGDDRTPDLRRHFLNDVTNEKLGELMAQEVNAHGLIVFRDELVGFLKTLDRQGHEADKAFYMEAWNGSGSFTFDRIARGTIHIPYACLSLFGGIQPGPLASYLRGSFRGEDNDGFIQRFQVLMYPDPPLTFLDVDREPDAEARERAIAVFRALDALDPVSKGCAVEDESGIPCLRFDDAAQEFFLRWRLDLENRLRSGMLSALMATHLSKYRKLMPSLALIFHLVDSYQEPVLGPVSRRAAVTAASWCELLEAHASRIYRAAMDGDADLATRLSERLEEALPDPFTIRDVYRKQWSGLTTNEEVRSALAVLEDRNWVKVVDVPTTDRGGRPTELVYIHPKVRSGGVSRS